MRIKIMKMYIFVCAFDDSGLDVEVQGVYKSEEKAIGKYPVNHVFPA